MAKSSGFNQAVSSVSTLPRFMLFFLLSTQLTSIVRRKLSNSSAVQMLLKFGWWFSTVVSSLSNQASLSSALAHTSGLRAIFSKDTHLRDNSSPGEPATSFT